MLGRIERHDLQSQLNKNLDQNTRVLVDNVRLFQGSAKNLCASINTRRRKNRKTAEVTYLMNSPLATSKNKKDKSARLSMIEKEGTSKLLFENVVCDLWNGVKRKKNRTHSTMEATNKSYEQLSIEREKERGKATLFVQIKSNHSLSSGRTVVRGRGKEERSSC
jgi:hypothetical protein